MRILIVEDDPKVGRFLQQGLEEEGFETTLASDGDDALAKAAADNPGLILLDRMLPQKNGLEVVTALRARGQRTPVLMLTARDSPEDREHSLAAGADDLIGKPFRFDELLDRIRALAPDPAR